MTASVRRSAADGRRATPRTSEALLVRLGRLGRAEVLSWLRVLVQNTHRARTASYALHAPLLEAFSQATFHSSAASGASHGAAAAAQTSISAYVPHAQVRAMDGRRAWVRWEPRASLSERVNAVPRTRMMVMDGARRRPRSHGGF